MVRASAETREGILDFFAMVLQLNQKRAGMRVSSFDQLSSPQVDHRTVSSDGYMMNLNVVLLKLFEPVMDVTFSKVRKQFADTDHRSIKLMQSISKAPNGSTLEKKQRSKRQRKKLTSTSA